MRLKFILWIVVAFLCINSSVFGQSLSILKGYTTEQTMHINYNSSQGIHTVHLYEEGYLVESKTTNRYGDADFYLTNLSAGAHTYSAYHPSFQDYYGQYWTEDEIGMVYSKVCPDQYHSVSDDSRICVNAADNDIYYITEDNYVAHLYWSSSQSKMADGKLGSRKAISGSSLLRDSNNGTIYFVSKDENDNNKRKIFKYYWSNSAWQCGPVCSGQWNEPHSDSKLALTASGNIVYVSTSNTVCHLYGGSGNWSDGRLSSVGAAYRARAFVTHPTSSTIYYANSSDRKIHRLYYSNQWVDNLILGQIRLVGTNSELAINSQGNRIAFFDSSDKIHCLEEEVVTWVPELTGIEGEPYNLVYDTDNIYYINGARIHKAYKTGSTWTEDYLLGHFVFQLGLINEQIISVTDDYVYFRHNIGYYDEYIYRYHKSDYTAKAAKKLQKPIKENQQFAINVYPNPTNGMFQIANIPEFCSIEVYDAASKQVYQNRNYDGGLIDISNNSPGLYIIQGITNDGILLSEKVILQK